MVAGRSSAPKLAVTRVDRVGAWGSVSYHHLLECSHIEVRRRCAKVGDRIACTRCQEVVQRRSALAELAQPSQVFESDEDVAAEMTQEARIKANVASLLGIPADTIDVTMHPARRITIFLSPQEVTRLSGT
jgi:hypothetical protein